MDLKTAIYRYCNYQERCHQEVNNKLYELGATSEERNNLMAELIEQDLLNEERFARSFARGRFRMKQWGKRKIIAQLQFRKISEYCIKKALNEIDDDDYLHTLLKLAEKKLLELRSEKNIFVRKAKIYSYLQQKGFEPDLINDVIKQILDRKAKE